MIRAIISRLTMKKISHQFTDQVNGKAVYLFEDCYGVSWLAHSKFELFRVRSIT